MLRQHVQVRLDGQTFSAFAAAVTQYATSTDGAHTYQKTVGLMSFTIVGLKCAFHGFSSFPYVLKFNLNRIIAKLISKDEGFAGK